MELSNKLKFIYLATLLGRVLGLSKPHTNTSEELEHDDLCSFLDSDNQTFICQSDKLTGIRVLEEKKISCNRDLWNGFAHQAVKQQQCGSKNSELYSFLKISYPLKCIFFFLFINRQWSGQLRKRLMKPLYIINILSCRSPWLWHPESPEDIRPQRDQHPELVGYSVCGTQHHKHCYLGQPQTRDYSQQNLGRCLQLTEPDHQEEPSPGVAGAW